MLRQPGRLLKTFWDSFLFLFFLLFIFTFPFPYSIIPNVGSFFADLINPIVVFLGERVFGYPPSTLVFITSDSAGMYVQMILLASISFVLSVILSYFCSLAPTHPASTNARLSPMLLARPIYAYYLSLQLFIYGFNKLFLYQFYFPEANTLYTPVGYLTKDILYWSSMGTSPVYSVFLGVCEIIPAVLLLFHRTRSIGAIAATFVLLNVFMINVGFDISVKCYSAFLLMYAIRLCVPILKSGILFSSERQSPITRYEPVFKHTVIKRFYPVVKALLIGMIIVESLYLYADQHSENQAIEEDSQLIGAYEVQVHTIKSDTLTLEDPRKINRFFVHRKGYFIFQFRDTVMKDYKLEIDSQLSLLKLQDYDSSSCYFQYALFAENNREVLYLQNDTVKVWANKVKLEKIPLVQSR